MASDPPHVALFVTCLVDLMRPGVGFAAVKLLEDAGCRVSVPVQQTCCGQPAYNAGDRAHARTIARQVIAAFEGFDFVVAPSGSCAAMIKVHYPDLLADQPEWVARAEALAGRTHELTRFLHDVLKVDAFAAQGEGRVTYHDGCSGLREMGIKNQPRALLSRIAGLALVESPKAETCCGFGGTFCVKYPDISAHILDAKIDDIAATGADTVIGGDLGCLLNIAGRLQRRGLAVKARHVAEVLAGSTAAAIGEP
ncbi:MAG: (Fe-S)-binding protein [Rhodospirillales bacterium]|jgi:L-lactate dehydrogenase complex protein LldE|nr:(Fe-S)-binding protein [Rhodospirillales bacterium]MDP6883368.1 (Fe-S)-binding protein [Rhodospirillales bacterium]